MARRTEKFRELLLKQRKEFQDAFDKLFFSFEIILDNIDQEYEQRKQVKIKKDTLKDRAI